MPLRAIHERRTSPSGTPMRRFADLEPGDTFRYKGHTYMKSSDGSGYGTEPMHVDGIIQLPDDQWVCEF